MLPYYRIASDLQGELLEEIEKLPVCDCHEHLGDEAGRVAGHVDAFSLFSHYCQHDLYSSGMDMETRNKVLWSAEDVDWKWRQFKPFYERCKHLSYFRSAHIAMEHFYGERELTDANYRAVTERIQAANRPGLYRRVIADACGIKAVLNNDEPGGDTQGGLIRQSVHAFAIRDNKKLAKLTGLEDNSAVTMDEIERKLTEFVAANAKLGIYGVKFSTQQYRMASREDAFETLKTVMTDRDVTLPYNNDLNDYILRFQMRLAHEQGLVCMVHTGYWYDYRDHAPQNNIPIIMNNLDIKFDIYHLGYPNMREAFMLAKTWPNVRLNLAWNYIINQKSAYEALDEILEFIPEHKVFAFGGDYYMVEKILGHLTMARETLSAVLAKKVRCGELTAEKALDLARKMLYDNPAEFYKLDKT